MLDLRKVGAYISDLRKQKDMTQVELADMLNVSHQAVSKWERGESMPDIGTLPRLSEIFLKSIDNILAGGEDGKNNSHGEGIIIKDIFNNNLAELSEKINEGEVGIQAIAGVAPILKPSTINKVVKGLRNIDIKHLNSLAPFLNRETLNKLVNLVIDNGFETEHLLDIASFLSQDNMDKIIEKMKFEKVSTEFLSRLAPSVSRKTLSRLIEHVEQGQIHANTALNLVPFLAREDVLKLISKMELRELTGDVLSGLAPFLDKDALSTIVESMMLNLGRD